MSKQDYINGLNAEMNVEQLTARIMAIVDEQDMLNGKYYKILSKAKLEQRGQSHEEEREMDALSQEYTDLNIERQHLRKKIAEKMPKNEEGTTC